MIKGHKSGTHRTISPSETLARMKPYLAPMGITRVANVTGLDTIGIPVFMACRPNSRSLAVSQGKGLDLDAARASAVMESVEGYRAEAWVSTYRLSQIPGQVKTATCHYSVCLTRGVQCIYCSRIRRNGICLDEGPVD